MHSSDAFETKSSVEDEETAALVVNGCNHIEGFEALEATFGWTLGTHTQPAVCWL